MRDIKKMESFNEFTQWFAVIKAKPSDRWTWTCNETLSSKLLQFNLYQWPPQSSSPAYVHKFILFSAQTDLIRSVETFLRQLPKQEQRLRSKP